MLCFVQSAWKYGLGVPDLKREDWQWGKTIAKKRWAERELWLIDTCKGELSGNTEDEVCCFDVNWQRGRCFRCITYKILFYYT